MTTSYSIAIQGGGSSIQQQIVRSGDSTPNIAVSLPAGKAGTLSTRTDNNTGVATVASGHGITTSDVVSAYWSGGRRYGMTVTATDSTTISVDGGSGDNLPTQGVSIVVSKEIAANLLLDGDNAKLVAVSFEVATSSASKCRATFFDAVAGGGSAVGSGLELTANAPSITDIEGGATNIYTGSPILSVVASNGDSSSAATLKIIAEVDATP